MWRRLERRGARVVGSKSIIDLLSTAVSILPPLFVGYLSLGSPTMTLSKCEYIYIVLLTSASACLDEEALGVNWLRIRLGKIDIHPARSLHKFLEDCSTATQPLTRELLPFAFAQSCIGTG